MRTFDLDPLFRSTIGFDHLFGLLYDTFRQEDDHYPPYDITRLGDDRYAISMALAGFGQDDVTVIAEANQLTVEGRRSETSERQYLYQGIASRGFRRQFSLADHVQVESATLQDGILTITLLRQVPEAKKPRRIPIGNGGNRPELEHKAA